MADPKSAALAIAFQRMKIIAASLNSAKTTAPQQDEQKKPAVEPNKESGSANLSKLPPNLKAQILSILSKTDPETAEAALSEDKSNTKPPAVFSLDKLQSDKLKLFSSAELKSLLTEGYIVKEKFLGSENLVQTVLSEARDMVNQGKLKEAGMKAESGVWKSQGIRGDKICWLHKGDKDLPGSISGLMEHMDALRVELNEAVAFGSDKIQAQAAVYEGQGSRYVRHRDTYQNGPARRLTAIFYPNVGWKQEHGGQLRMFLPGGPKDIEPLADRLVIFLSSWVEHEVLPSHAYRMALTLWFA